jgi:hypothetical protein
MKTKLRTVHAPHITSAWSEDLGRHPVPLWWQGSRCTAANGTSWCTATLSELLQDATLLIVGLCMFMYWGCSCCTCQVAHWEQDRLVCIQLWLCALAVQRICHCANCVVQIVLLVPGRACPPPHPNFQHVFVCCAFVKLHHDLLRSCGVVQEGTDWRRQLMIWCPALHLHGI